MYPAYLYSDSAEQRIAKCIRFELDHGGDEPAAAAAILRDIEDGYIRLPIAKDDRAAASAAPVHQLVGQSDEDMQKEALRLAGVMADRAISLVGGNGINGRISPCGILGMSACAELLQRSVDAYNDHIIKWSMRKP